MDVTFFRAFFDADVKGVSITPAEYDETVPVIVAQLSNDTAGQIFGVSKVKGGNRSKLLAVFLSHSFLLPVWRTGD